MLLFVWVVLLDFCLFFCFFVCGWGSFLCFLEKKKRKMKRIVFDRKFLWLGCFVRSRLILPSFFVFLSFFFCFIFYLFLSFIRFSSLFSRKSSLFCFMMFFVTLNKVWGGRGTKTRNDIVPIGTRFAPLPPLFGAKVVEVVEFCLKILQKQNCFFFKSSSRVLCCLSDLVWLVPTPTSTQQPPFFL